MDVPLSGWKRKLHLFFTWWLRWTVIGWYGTVVDVTKHDEDDTDYSKYLGPDWKKNKFKGKRVSTIVSNHIGFLEIVAFMSTFELPPAFVAAHFIRNFPIGRSYISALQGIYANRASGKEELEKAVKQITDRQELIETSEHEYAPLCIFAEGSQTNGLNISRFRRGAFIGNYALNPVMIKFDCKTVT